MKRTLATLIFLMPLISAYAYDNCDSLRQNNPAYQECVNNAYGPNARPSEPSYLKYYRSNQEAEAQEEALRREEAARQAAARQEAARRQAEQEAKRRAEEKERRETAEAVARFDNRIYSQYDAQESALRRIAVSQLNSLATAAMQKKTITPADYNKLVIAAYPQWDLMHYWAEKAARQYGGRFKLLLALADTVGCPEYSNLDRAKSKWARCDDKYIEEGLKRAQASFAEVAPVDRLLTCFTTYAWLRDMPRQLNEAKFLRRQAVYQSCMAQLTDFPDPARFHFMDTARDAYTDVGYEEHFLLFFHPAREQLGGLGDTALIRKMVRESRLMSKLQRRVDPELREIIQKEAREGGLSLAWLDKTPALPLAMGPTAQRQVGQLSAVGKAGPTAARQPHSAQLQPRNDWVNWERSWIMLNNMGNEYRKTANPAMALLLHDVALEFAEVAGPPNNKRIPWSLLENAYCLSDNGKEKEANLLYQRTLAILLSQWDKYDGPESETAAWALQRIGVLQRNMGDYAKAEESLNAALALRKRIQSSKHADIASVYENLAILYGKQKRSTEAAQMQLEADIIYGKRQRQ